MRLDNQGTTALFLRLVQTVTRGASWPNLWRDCGLLLLAQILFACSIAHAGLNVLQSVVERNGQSVTSQGMACAFHVEDGTAYWATSAHVLKGSHSPAVGIYQRDEWVPATVVSVDWPIDVAIVSTPSPDSPNLYQVYQGELPDGAEVQIVHQDYTATVGHVVANGQLIGEVSPGDSGGPILYQGQLAGIIIESTEVCHRVVATTRIFQRSSSTYQQWGGNCPGGVCPQPMQPGLLIQPPVVPIVTTPVIPGRPRRPATNYVPAVLIPAIQAQPQQPQQPQLPASGDQVDARLQRIEKAIEALLQRPPQAGLPGPQGERGLPGERGPQGPGPTDEQIAAAVATWMQFNQPQSGGVEQATIERAVAAYLAANPQQITVVVKDNGETVFSQSGVPSGSKVTVPIDRQVSEK